MVVINSPLVKCGVISGVTAASGGMQLPNIPLQSAKIWVPHVSAVGQTNFETTMFLGDAPYYDSDSRPQSVGLPLQFNAGAPTEIHGITNLDQLRVVSSVSGAFLAYFVVQ